MMKTVLLALSLLLTLHNVHSADWRVEASSTQMGENTAYATIDNDLSTRWGSAFDDNQWLIYDLRKPTQIHGFAIFWEAAYASNYKIEVSNDKTNWQTVYHNTSADGNADYIFIKPITAQYCKLTALKRATGWGISIWEFQVFDQSQNPLTPTSPNTQNLFDSNLNTTWQSPTTSSNSSLDIDLQHELQLTGIRIDWADTYPQNISAQTSTDNKTWQPLATIKNSKGQFDILLSSQRSARYIKLNFQNPSNPNNPIAIREISLRGPGEQLTPIALYKIAALKAPTGHYPPSLSRQQVYWTVSGVPNDTQESLLDEFGNLEAKSHTPLLMPYRTTSNNIYHAQNTTKITQSLAQGHLPLPTVNWQHPDLDLNIQAITHGPPNQSTTYLRYRLTNKTNQPQQGTFHLLLRPLQINPPWQHGGLAPIFNLSFTPSHNNTRIISVNNQPLYIALNHTPAFTATSFTNSDIIDNLPNLNTQPSTSQQTYDDPPGLLSAALSYPYNLKPNQHIDYFIAAPLHDQSQLPAKHFTTRTFNSLKQKLTKDWQDRLSHIDITLNDREITDTLKSQIAYILINQDGHAIQPGSRNYNRSWMRDGSITATAMMRTGLFKQALDYINWYKITGISPEGLVHPILNTNGSVNTGFGGDLEYDSQGQYLYLILTYYRLTHDKQFLRENYPTLKRVLQHTQHLREQTTSPDYLADLPAAKRFQGILPPSISHEGYSDPKHSYWDNFFALQAWQAGRFAALELNDQPTADWAQAEYQKLYTGLQNSIKNTINYKNIPYLPASADLGDPDPTSISIAFFPCNQQHILPNQQLQYTYNDYAKQIHYRAQPDASFTYTPYEVRNINALVALGKKQAAHNLLNLLMQHRRPTGWRHLAEVVHSDPRKGSYIGDMPHTWVGAGFVHAVLNLLYLESDDSLQLLPAVPNHWLEGDGITLKNLPTRFGNLNMTAKLTNNQLHINLAPLTHTQNLKTLSISWPDTPPTSATADGKSLTISDNHILIPTHAKNIILTFPPTTH